MELNIFVMSIDYNEKEEEVLSSLIYDEEHFYGCGIPIDEGRPWASFYILLN